MRPFELVEPKSLAEASSILCERDGAKPIAGGTALLNLIKHGLYVPKTLVNLKKIAAGEAITYDAQRGLRVGALATLYDIEASSLVRRHYPILSQACHVVANIRIRHMATIGGNLAHGDYQSDPPAVLVALDAGVELTSTRGQRQIRLSDFFLGSYETALESGELVSALLIPPLPQDLRGVYLKFTTGSSEERPCAGIAALAQVENGICRELRLTVGAVSPKPVRMHAAEAMARGRELTRELIDRVAAEAVLRIDPIDDVRGPADYKRHLVRVLTRRAIAACIGVNGSERRQ
jgi:carbon-monoxide dehydrogenase medium subunit